MVYITKTNSNIHVHTHKNKQQNQTQIIPNIEIQFSTQPTTKKMNINCVLEGYTKKTIAINKARCIIKKKKEQNKKNNIVSKQLYKETKHKTYYKSISSVKSNNNKTNTSFNNKIQN